MHKGRKKHIFDTAQEALKLHISNCAKITKSTQFIPLKKREARIGKKHAHRHDPGISHHINSKRSTYAAQHKRNFHSTQYKKHKMHTYYDAHEVKSNKAHTVRTPQTPDTSHPAQKSRTKRRTISSPSTTKTTSTKSTKITSMSYRTPLSSTPHKFQSI